VAVFQWWSLGSGAADGGIRNPRLRYPPESVGLGGWISLVSVTFFFYPTIQIAGGSSVAVKKTITGVWMDNF
jgi:hypothetical protein